MELYFLRHGIATDASPTGEDADRQLTKEGAAKIKAAARGLRRLGLTLDALLTSPLPRALETARIMARELGAELQLADELAPGCDLARLQGLLGEHRAAERVMLVGHEPDLSGLVAALSGARVQMRKGGLARVDIDMLEPGQGTLAWLLPPRVQRSLE